MLKMLQMFTECEHVVALPMLMRVVGSPLAMPTLFGLLPIVSMWTMGPGALGFIIASRGWQRGSTLVRGEMLSLSERDFVDLARMVGAGDTRMAMLNRSGGGGPCVRPATGAAQRFLCV